jgi:ferritin-like metal-binding protein YciE
MYDRRMTGAIAFDTHRFVKRLTESGFTEQQAETLAEEHVALLNANLATKIDIAEVKAEIESLRQETRSEIAKVEAGVETLRQETSAAIAAVKVDLLKWLFGALIAQGGLIVALVKIL